MSQLLPVLVLAVFVAAFGAGLMFLASLFGAKGSKSKTHLDSYECGVEVSQTTSTKIPIKYYLTAILFILFDIEIIFMYPWALSYGDFIESGLTGYILASMGLFLAVFIFGLFWEIKSRALEWE
ncbi:MAG: NADH-quinone oxidoreductase subunit A [Bdellovibrionales bacterium]